MNITEYNFLETTVSIKELILPNKRIVVNLHHNELDALKIAEEIVPLYKLSQLIIENNHNRFITISSKNNFIEIDPNRIFTTVGREVVLDYIKAFDDFELKNTFLEFSNYLCNVILNYKNGLVISLHNNKNEDFSVLSYLEDGSLSDTVEKYNFVDIENTGNFYLVTENSHFDYLQDNKQNVVLQNDNFKEDDGSLSFFCKQNNIPYINIEAVHGDYFNQLSLFNLIKDL